MIELYEFEISGNAHKVRLLLSFLGLAYEKRILNAKEKEHKSDFFLSLNPFGQVPVLKDGEDVIRDSQAILVYLAKKYGKEHWFPSEPYAAAKVISWLSIASSEVTRGPAALRQHFLLSRPIHLQEAEAITLNLFTLLENHLHSMDWLATDQLTIADIAMYPYIALSHQGNVSLDSYPNIRKWLQRIEMLPNYVSMKGIELQR